MSKCRTLFRIILTSSLLLMLTITLSACGKTPQGNASITRSNDTSGEIISHPFTIISILDGDVLIMKPGEKEWVRGEVGMTLGIDYKVKTETNGHAAITFFEGSTIELEKNTEIGLAELEMVDTGSIIKLKQTIGETMSRVKKLVDPASRYEIETPAAIAAVRGTTMYVAVEQNGVTIVGNIEGLVSVIAQGVEIELPVNTHTTIVPGKQPGEPQPGANSLTPTSSPTSATPTTTPGSSSPTTPPTSTGLKINGKIAFQSDRDGNYEIYVMNPDGTGQTRLTNNNYDDGAPAWSPDGTKIAFHTNRDGNHEIYTMNTDGSGQTRLTNNNYNDEWPSWSPDGTKIIFSRDLGGNWEIYVMNADGSGETRLTNNNGPWDIGAHWSPDGTRIVFLSHRDGDSDVYLMNPDGSGQTILTNNNYDEELATWSPDGTKIVFASSRDGNYEIYVMNADGSGQMRLTNNSYVDAHNSWSPDGTKIVFLSDRDGNREIYVMNADGSGQTRLTNNNASDTIYGLAWQSLSPPPTPTPTTTTTATPKSIPIIIHTSFPPLHEEALNWQSC
jgi:Tol biopolymer transport system component